MTPIALPPPRPEIVGCSACGVVGADVPPMRVIMEQITPQSARFRVVTPVPGKPSMVRSVAVDLQPIWAAAHGKWKRFYGRAMQWLHDKLRQWHRREHRTDPKIGFLGIRIRIPNPLEAVKSAVSSVANVVKQATAVATQALKEPTKVAKFVKLATAAAKKTAAAIVRRAQATTRAVIKAAKDKVIRQVASSLRAVVRSPITASLVAAAAMVFPPVGVPAAAALAAANTAISVVETAERMRKAAQAAAARGNLAERALRVLSTAVPETRAALKQVTIARRLPGISTAPLPLTPAQAKQALSEIAKKAPRLAKALVAASKDPKKAGTLADVLAKEGVTTAEVLRRTAPALRETEARAQQVIARTNQIKALAATGNPKARAMLRMMASTLSAQREIQRQAIATAIKVRAPKTPRERAAVTAAALQQYNPVFRSALGRFHPTLTRLNQLAAGLSPTPKLPRLPGRLTPAQATKQAMVAALMRAEARRQRPATPRPNPPRLAA